MSNWLLELEEKANLVRRDVVETCVANNAGHIAPSLSVIDTLVALYYRVMTISPQDPEWDGRDRLVFSKAHGCYGLYSILADLGYIPRKEWETFYKGSELKGCSERRPEFGLEAGCGSLGHGLPIAVGLAMGLRLQKKTSTVFCIVGDGELQEGSCWEAIQYAVHMRLGNLVLIVDDNKLQAIASTDSVMGLGPGSIEKKLIAFGMEGKTCNGHDMNQLVEVLSSWTNDDPRVCAPKFLVADTIKGYGLKCMENVAKFHYRVPTAEELALGNRYE